MKLQVIIDKKTLGICALLSSFLLHGSTYGQCEIEEGRQVIYKYDSSSWSYAEFVIKNNSQDIIYLWIDTEVIDDDSPSLEQQNNWLFFKYIRAPKCELGLYFLCHDGSIYFSNGSPPPPVIGCTFIKKILPDELFTIYSINESIGKESIHYVKQDIVSSLFKNNCLDDFCYKKPYIIVQ